MVTDSENQEEGSALSYPQIVTRMGGGDVVTHSLLNVDGCGECSEDCPLLPSYPQPIVRDGQNTRQMYNNVYLYSWSCDGTDGDGCSVLSQHGVIVNRGDLTSHTSAAPQCPP